MRYQFVQELVGRFPVAVLCRVMQVSKSGFYAWRTRAKSQRSRENQRLLLHIRSVFEESDQTYGSPRIWRELQEQGIHCGKNRVARLMRSSGIRAELPSRFRITTDSEHSLPTAPNLLAQDFTADAANERWAADITYVWTREGWLYLAVVLDLFSRRVVGWSMQPRLEKTLVLDALEMALAQRSPSAGLLHHSDRGSQYASRSFQERLQRDGIVCSMSGRGNCFDNAVVESFFSTLKRERIHRRDYITRAEARADVFEYIEVWYNRKRRHSALGYLSPAEFEKRRVQNGEIALRMAA